jgi:hypothetical protein
MILLLEMYGYGIAKHTHTTLSSRLDCVHATFISGYETISLFDSTKLKQNCLTNNNQITFEID